jgi:hypothetical protein
MQTNVAAWQLDMFGSASPIIVTPTKPDPLPDPAYWNEEVRNKMADALIDLAADSRRGDSMPESLMDCCVLISDRLRPKQKLRFEMADYKATLGWIMTFWNGAVSYEYVCRVHGVDPEILQEVILNNPLLRRDMEEVRRDFFGTLL